jgi:hypothetical protein
MTLLVGLLWEGYSVVSRVPSELSAIGAPTRPLWIWLGMVYAVLMIAFGWIVWTSAPPNRALRVVGALLMAYTVFGQFWPPMHQRAVLAAGGGTLTDTLHLVWAMITGFFFMLIVGFGAAALGKRFRVYSIATMVIGLACGAVTGTYASQVQADLPTPWVGVWERISIATFMAWIAVLATALLRAPRAAATADPPTFSSIPGRWARSVRATPQERTRALPGDELIENPIGSLHHAITIRRARHEVWPWLAQMGASSRAGWYSHDFLDNGRRPECHAHHPRAPTAGRRHDLPGGTRRHRRLHAARLRTGALSHSRLDDTRRWTSHDVGVRARRGCARFDPSHRACTRRTGSPRFWIAVVGGELPRERDPLPYAAEAVNRHREARGAHHVALICVQDGG